MANKITEVRLSDGSTFFAEVDDDPSPPAANGAGAGRTRVSLTDKTKINFDEAMKNIETAATRFVQTQQSLLVPPDSCEIVFGIKVSAEGNAILAKMSGDVNFSVTLKWERK
ncbi:MAG TPA: CU044_2847 family protein [Allosphingosinicella sp.]|jgi:hypothetical protein